MRRRKKKRTMNEEKVKKRTLFPSSLLSSYLRHPHRRHDHDPLYPGLHCGVDLPLLPQPVNFDRGSLVVAALPDESRASLFFHELEQQDFDQRALLDLGHGRGGDDDGLCPGERGHQRGLGTVGGDVDDGGGGSLGREVLQSFLRARDGDDLEGVGAGEEVVDGQLASASPGARDDDLRFRRRSHGDDRSAAAASGGSPLLTEALALRFGDESGSRGRRGRRDRSALRAAAAAAAGGAEGGRPGENLGGCCCAAGGGEGGGGLFWRCCWWCWWWWSERVEKKKKSLML